MAAYLIPTFFLTALLYATAGFGGGSTYLALLALTDLPVGQLRPLALCANLVVAGGGAWRFWRAGQLPGRRAGGLVLASVPAAFLGGLVALPREQYLGLLAVVLLAAGLLTWWRPRAAENEPPASRSQRTGLALGGATGLLAGVVGIGGGVFLAPALYRLRWGGARRIAATTSLFICANSLAGLAGQFAAGARLPGGWGPVALLLAVLAGGQLGTRLTLGYLSPTLIRRTTAVLIIAVALRLLHQWFTG